jgi:uncharacterized protein YhhL (DUF1145 family)
MLKRTGTGIKERTKPKLSVVSNLERYAVLIVGIFGLLSVPPL